VKVVLITPETYYGAMMDIVKERRGTDIITQFLDDGQVVYVCYVCLGEGVCVGGEGVCFDVLCNKIMRHNYNFFVLLEQRPPIIHQCNYLYMSRSSKA
jgi:hypothetical protein